MQKLSITDMLSCDFLGVAIALLLARLRVTLRQLGVAHRCRARVRIVILSRSDESPTLAPRKPKSASRVG